MFSSRKINALVEFPVHGLNLSKYFVEGEKEVYDLYAVSNHFGNMGGGHYTAFCFNHIYKKWFEFDDQRVSAIDESKLVTKAAYVLFYKKRI